MDPLADPKIRFVAARALAKQYLAHANDLVHAAERIRFRARRAVAIANEAMREAETAACEIAVASGEEREIEREIWRVD